MSTTNAVKDPKNGVISCWVCTGVMILVDILRITMLYQKKGIIDLIFLASSGKISFSSSTISATTVR